MFGGRKGKGHEHQNAVPPELPRDLINQEWPRLPDAPRPEHRQIRNQLPPNFSGAKPPPIPPPRPSAAAGASPAEIRHAAEEELLARITGFRSAVADALYEISNDYRILCNLAHADLKSCGDLMEELRQRLSTETHYRVLAKLDEAHALAKAALAKPKP